MENTSSWKKSENENPSFVEIRCVETILAFLRIGFIPPTNFPRTDFSLKNRSAIKIQLATEKLTGAVV